MTAFRFALIALAGILWSGAATAELTIRIAVLRINEPAPLPLSRLDIPTADDGFAGGQVGLADSTTTGRFLKQSYELVESTIEPDGIPAEVARLADEGVSAIIAMGGADSVLALSEAAEGRDLFILNAKATDNRLRGSDCRANVMHIAPSRAMLADGLTQYMVWKKWTDWVLVSGSHPNDNLLAEAYRDSARKFGARIVDERVYEDTGGARRSDSGHVLVQKQIPVFMQRTDEHDVVVVADESSVFGYYMPYRGWDARPVVGSAGLIASMWHPGHEGWGATQLQRRFERHAGRRMTDQDYLVWLAMRAIGEAVTRTNSADPATLKDYMLSEKFEIAGFKGLALSFRTWNNQLRNGVILGDGKLVVSVSPQEEFLHRNNRLDTLGIDEPQSDCKF